MRKMKKLNYDPCIKHFSHEHPLEFFKFQDQALNSVLCSGCKLKPSKWIYTCKACNYILHIKCSEMPQLIHHPADPNHNLILLSQAAYPQGIFNCDACGHPGDGFCYHCSSCQMDLHILCASMPLSLTHHAHPHPLNLMFDSPYQAKKFSCDICHKVGLNHWLYRCNACKFDAHLDCANGIVSPVHHIQMSRPQILHHHNSFPVANHHQFKQVGSTSHPHDYYGIYLPTDPKQTVQPPKNNIGIGHAEGVTQQVGQNIVQNIIGSVTQQVGQNLVQNIIGSNDGGIGADLLTSVLGNFSFE